MIFAILFVVKMTAVEESVAAVVATVAVAVVVIVVYCSGYIILL